VLSFRNALETQNSFATHWVWGYLISSWIIHEYVGTTFLGVHWYHCIDTLLPVYAYHLYYLFWRVFVFIGGKWVPTWWSGEDLLTLMKWGGGGGRSKPDRGALVICASPPPCMILSAGQCRLSMGWQMSMFHSCMLGNDAEGLDVVISLQYSFYSYMYESIWSFYVSGTGSIDGDPTISTNTSKNIVLCRLVVRLLAAKCM
jgi:hypothetical protein